MKKTPADLAASALELYGTVVAAYRGFRDDLMTLSPDQVQAVLTRAEAAFAKHRIAGVDAEGKPIPLPLLDGPTTPAFPCVLCGKVPDDDEITTCDQCDKLICWDCSQHYESHRHVDPARRTNTTTYCNECDDVYGRLLLDKQEGVGVK